MKKLLVVAVMVLLSTAAWGETYPNPVSQLRETWDDGVKRFHNNVVVSGTSSAITYDSYQVLGWCRQNQPPKKLKADDPTAWKQDPLKECRELQAKGYAVSCLDDSSFEYILKAEKPRADSRYRLERNEVTGEYRIAWLSDGKWEEYPCWMSVYDKDKGWWVTSSPLYDKWTLKQWIDKLKELRDNEARYKLNSEKAKAWKLVE